MKLWHNNPNKKPNEKRKAREVLSLMLPSNGVGIKNVRMYHTVIWSPRGITFSGTPNETFDHQFSLVWKLDFFTLGEVKPFTYVKFSRYIVQNLMHNH
jgi:hypothetical protein